MEIIEVIQEKFKVWLLIQRDKVLNKQLAKIPSDNVDDYFFNPLTQQFVYKDSSLNVQIGWENTLNVVKTKIESVNLSVENLEAIIDDIAQVNIDTTALTAIISNIATVNANINNLQATITDIANIETNIINLQAIIGNIGTINANITNLQAIITDVAQMNVDTTALQAIIGNIAQVNIDTTALQAIIADIANIESLNVAISGNIGTMNTNITNLQAIITDIANIETLNSTISGNITALTAIIANIGTMNTNIGNLQAIITDIANIETLNTTISGNITSLTAIIANIGTMNTNINNLQAIITDIANIETQNIAMNTSIATINTNIGTINTAIASIEAHQVDIDFNINSVETLTNNIINQENKGVKSTDNTLNVGTNITGDFTSSNYLYNQLTVKIYRTTPTLTNYELQISIRDTTTADDSEVLSTWIIERAKVVIRTFTFNPTHDINYYFGNEGSDNIKIDYIFSYSELEQPHIISLDSRIPLSSSITPYFNRYNHLINRMRIILYQTGTLNATITLTQRSNNSSMNDTLINKTITSGTNYSELFDFNPCSYFSLLIQNNNASQELSFHIILFFSKNLKPELDEHIDDSTIHFLENSINLANINEKSHTNLTDKGVNTHPAIDTHIADGTKHFLENSINLASINEKSHTNLTDKGVNTHPAIDTHIADGTKHFLENSINLANINEKSYNSLTDKPSIPEILRYIPPMSTRYANGWILGYQGWYIPISDGSAQLSANFRAPATKDDWEIVMTIYRDVGVSPIIVSGKKYLGVYPSGNAFSNINKFNGQNHDFTLSAVAMDTVDLRSGNFSASKGDIIHWRWDKDNNDGANNIVITGLYLTY